MLLLVIGTQLSACAQSVTVKDNTAIITVTDQLGRVVALDKIPQRIISISPSATEIIYALNLSDRLVGRTDYCDYPPQVIDKPSVGGFSNPSIEQIIALAPDLVLGASIHEDQVIPQLEEKGIKVLVLEPKTIDQVLQAFTLVGDITGAKEAAKELVDNMQQRVNIIDDKVNKLTASQKPGVFYVVWHDPLMVAGKETLLNDLITRAGGTNLTTTSGYYTTISLESVIQADPKILIAGTGHGDDSEQTYQFIMQEPRLQSTTARKNGALYRIDGNLSSRYGPRVFDALEEFFHFIHPELFKETK